MNLVLAYNATREAASSWLRQIVRDFGIGFHPDTRAEEYIRPDGHGFFTPAECETLSNSLGRLFAILGDELPYEICASEAATILAEAQSMKPPIEYHDPDFQQHLLRHGTREQLIDWLCWNDPNGIYTDEDSLAEDRPNLTLEQARHLMCEQVERDSVT